MKYFMLARVIMRILIAIILPFLAKGRTERVGSTRTPTADHKKLYSEGRPNMYKEGERIELWVNSLTSPDLPYSIDYYKFPFCQSFGGPRWEALYFNEIMAGDRIATSPYDIFMKEDMYCQHLCVSNLGREERDGLRHTKMQRGIHNDYHQNWILDGLVAASRTEDDSTITTRYWQGFPMGFVCPDSGNAYIHNHVNIEIQYKAVGDNGDDKTGDKFEIVGFTVEPFSVKHKFERMNHNYVEGEEENGGTEFNPIDPIPSCQVSNGVGEIRPVHTNYDQIREFSDSQLASGEVLFTYDVIWIENNSADWSHRWDIYLTMDGVSDELMKTFRRYMTGCIGAVLLLVFAIGVMIRRLPNRQRYQSVATSDNSSSTNGGGIQTLHGDIFRPPDTAPHLFVFCCGAGMQLLTTFLLTLAVLAVFEVNPTKLRSTVITIGAGTFALTGFVNALTVACVSTLFFGERTTVDRSALLFPMTFPVLMFGLYEISNIIMMIKGVQNAVPFFPLQLYLLGWFTVSTPLVMLGSAFGYSLKNLCRPPFLPQTLRRQIPTQPKYLKRPFLMITTGLMPFITFIPTAWILNGAFWYGYYDIMFGFNFLNLIVTLAQSSLLSVIIMLIQLKKENHRWWWNVFCFGGSFGLYVFFYWLVPMKSMLGIYTVYILSLASAMLFLIGGSVSVMVCFMFNAWLFQSLAPLNDESDDGIGYHMIDEPGLFGNNPTKT